MSLQESRELQAARKLVAEHESELEAAHELVAQADRLRNAAERKEQTKRALKEQIGEAEACLSAFQAAQKAFAGLSNDALHRCGADGGQVGIGIYLAPSTQLPMQLAAAAEAAERRIERLRSDLASNEN